MLARTTVLWTSGSGMKLLYQLGLMHAAKKVLLVQPPFAAAEHLFSLLKCSFGEEQQLSALEDYIETSNMLQYNKY